MGNNTTKADRIHEGYLSTVAEYMDGIRRYSMDSCPDGTKKKNFRLKLDRSERKVQHILRRSRKENTRRKALDILRELEDWKEKDRTSVRNSILDNGAVESNSIIAGDAKKYDRSRQYRRSVENLHKHAIAADQVVMSKSADGSTKQHPHSQQRLTNGREQQKLLNTLDELDVIQGQVLSLQEECKTFQGYKDMPEYNKLTQNLMGLWDKLGKIKDPNLVAKQDAIIALISVNLKQLNRKCTENTRGSLSKNKVLCLAELFQMQYRKIANQVQQGGVKEHEEVYRILQEVYTDLGIILAQNPNECQLVTTQMIPSVKRRPVSIYVTSQQPMETDFDTVYMQEKQHPRFLKSNKSCPNLSSFNCGQPVHASYVSEVKQTNQMSTGGKHAEGSAEQHLDTLHRESSMLKYAVEEFNHYDTEKYHDLDERLIAILIQIEGLKGRVDASGEQRRRSLTQNVQAICKQLNKKHKQCARNDKYVQHTREISNILERLEVLNTQINENYAWHTDNPELKVVEDALKSALLRLDLIEPGGNRMLQTLRQGAIDEVRQAIKRLNEQRYTDNRYAGTEV